MKPILPLLLLICVLCSCKKDTKKQDAAPMYAVALKLTPSAKVPDPEGTAVDYVYYHLFDDKKEFVKSKVIQNYHVGDILRDTLPDGKYTALIAIGYQALTHHVEPFGNEAYANEIVYYYGQTNPDRRSTLASSLNFTFHDFYTVRYEFAVSGGHQSGVTLLRSPALVTLNIQDAVPANVDTIAIDIQEESTIFNASMQACNPLTLFPLKLNIRRNAAMVRGGQKINFYLINTITPITYTIYGLTVAKDTVYKTTVAATALLKRNDDVMLSGKLFTPGSGPFVINAVTQGKSN